MHKDTKATTTGQLKSAFENAIDFSFDRIVMATDETGVLYMFVPSEPSVWLMVNETHSQDYRDDLERGLQLAFMMEADPDGHVRAIWCDSAASFKTKAAIRMIIESMQCHEPLLKVDPARAIELVETGTLGARRIRYRPASLPDSLRDTFPSRSVRCWEKTVLAYLPSRSMRTSGMSSMRPDFLPSGQTLVILDPEESELLGLWSEDTLTSMLSGHTLSITTSSLRLIHRGGGILPDKEFRAWRERTSTFRNRMVHTTLNANDDDPAEDTVRHRRALGNATVDSLIVGLQTLEQKRIKQENYEERPLVVRIAAMIFLHPETSGLFGDILGRAVPGSVMVSIPSAALIDVGHAPAQRAFVQALAMHNANPAMLSRLLPALGRLKFPTLETENALRVFAFSAPAWNIQSTAQLALGAKANRLTARHPDRLKHIVSEFTRRLDTVGSAALQRQYLLVLGNAGSALALPAIQRFLSDSNSSLRSAATGSLRWIVHPHIEPLLIARLTSDPDSVVRREAAYTMSFRDLTPVLEEALRAAFLLDTTHMVRSMALNTLAKLGADSQAVMDLLKNASEQDAMQEIRKQAKEQLSRIESSRKRIAP